MHSTSPITGVTTPQTVDNETSSLCATGLAPGHILTGAILGLCRQHFSLAKNIVDPMLRELVWTKAAAGEKQGAGTSLTSPILIEPVTKWNPNLIEKRAAILVRRDARGQKRITIGDRYQGGQYPTANSVDTGDRHEVLIYGSYTLFCIGRTGAEAEALSNEVQLRYIEFGPIIREDLNLMKFAVMDMSPVSVLEEATQRFVVAVPLAYAFVHGWRLQSSAPVMKTAEIQPV